MENDKVPLSLIFFRLSCPAPSSPTILSLASIHKPQNTFAQGSLSFTWVEMSPGTRPVVSPGHLNPD